MFRLGFTVMVSLSALLGAEPLLANVSFTFSIGQNDVYETVVKSEAQQTTLPPGLYRIDKKTGESVLVAAGDVLGTNRSYKGILAYFGRGNGSAHDALTIVNERILLVNHNSSPKAPSSVLEFGGAGRSGIPVYDVIHGLPVDIPAVKSLDDVNVLATINLAAKIGFPNGGTFVLVSVRSPSPLGTGLTFGFIVEGHAQSDQKVKVHDGQAILLGYDFMSEQELSRLTTRIKLDETNGAHGLRLFSPSLIAKFKNQLSRIGDSPVARGWIEHISRFQRYLKSGVYVESGSSAVRSGDQSVGIPTYDFIRREESVDALPVETFHDGKRSFGQAFDPITSTFHVVGYSPQDAYSVRFGRSDLRFLRARDVDEFALAKLKVDKDPKSGKYLFYPQSGLSENMAPPEGLSFLFFSEGKPFFLIPMPSGVYESVSAGFLDLHSTDQINFTVMQASNSVGERTHKVILAHRKRQGAKSIQVYAGVLQEEADTLRALSSKLLLDVPSITFTEVMYRTVRHNGELLFDAVTPVKGHVDYAKAAIGDGESETVKTGPVTVPKKFVPYTRVLGNQFAREQVYLRALSDVPISRGFVHHREYDPSGANTSLTGFYVLPRGENATQSDDSFVPGYPLFGNTAKVKAENRDYVMQRQVLREGSMPTVRFPPIELSLVPFVEQLPTQRKSKDKKVDLTDVSSFHMGIALAPEGWSGAAANVDGQFHARPVNLPYKSLVFTKILQGHKNHPDHFNILLFFRSNPKVKNSADAVFVASGAIRWHSHPNQSFDVDISSFEKLHRGPVDPSMVKSHLLTDAEGALYWIDDPMADKDSTKYRVRKLDSPSQVVNHRLGQLRQPEHLRESESGFTAGSYRFGRWEIYTPHGLVETVHGLKSELEKHKKRGDKSDKKEKDESEEEQVQQATTDGENHLLEAFGSYLEEIAANPAQGLNRPKVIVVEPELKPKFKSVFFRKLAEGEGSFSLKNPKMHYYHANVALDDIEVAEELRYIADQRNSQTSVLYVDSDILKADAVVTRDTLDAADDQDEPVSTDDEEAPPVFGAAEAKARANMLVLLGSEGRAKSIRGYRALKNRQCQLPMITIVTPDEWQEIKERNAREIANGVADDFEMNYDFLTSNWTVWPPRSEKSPEDVKALTKVPYRAEEMRVFPTLDRILSDAASGALRGKQKIIIVPEELKSLVQKLVLLRWSTPDASAGGWNHRNRKLALHRILGAKSDQQNVVQDSFKAMRGAAETRNAVLYSDLDTIYRVGRPFLSNSHSGFKIKDPVRNTRGYLIESEARAAERSATSSENGIEDSAGEDQENADPASIRDELDNTVVEISDLNVRIASVKSRLNSSDVTMEQKFNSMLDALERDLARLKTVRDRLEQRLEQLIVGDDLNGDDPDERAEVEPAARRVNDKSAYPHLMWWVASEGMAVQPGKKFTWSLKDVVDRQVATILVGTEQELANIEHDMSFEGRFFNLREHFEIVQLESPDEQTKFDLVEQLFDRPEVNSRGIRFELKEDNGKEPRSQLIYHFINRIDQLAHDQKVERTSAFIRAYIALKNSLNEDLDLRRNGLISEKFIERLFTKVFPMPLNPDILEATDPLIRLRNQEQAVRDLQAAGYQGSQDLKRRFFDTVYSQTRTRDESRPIPNSQILYGGTSTGKTHLLRTFFKMLSLGEYKRNGNNENADFILLNVAKLTEGETNEPDKMTVSDAIAQIMDLMSQPKGARAHIVFDDFHKAASKGVRERLSQFIAGLFEAPNGMITVRSKDGTRHREIPVQNLNVYMTLNPTANEKVREAFVKPEHRGSERLKREVLAALSGDGFMPEESFLARWADVINLDQFPRSAKVPELVNRIRQNSARGGQMILVDPLAVDHLIDASPSAHARELLSPATAALTSLPPAAEKAPLYIVSVREEASKLRPLSLEAGGVNQQDLQSVVRRITQIDAVKEGDPRSLLRLMGFIMSNFRLQVFNHVSLEAHMTDILRTNVAGQSNILKTNALMAWSTHVLDKPRIPVAAMALNPDHLGFLSRSQLEELIRLHGSMKTPENSHFPMNLELMDRPEDLDLERFLTGTYSGGTQPRTRREILVETSFRLEGILAKAMALYLRLDSPAQLKEAGMYSEAQIQAWYQNLSDKEPQDEFLKLSQDIIEEFFTFRDRFHGAAQSDQGEAVAVNIYDEFRLFAYVLDKAILRLPWGSVANFTLKVAHQSSDFSLGTRASFRDYVSAHQLSAFTIATPEFMKDMLGATTIGSGESMAQRVDGLKEHFNKVCETLLQTSGPERTE